MKSAPLECSGASTKRADGTTDTTHLNKRTRCAESKRANARSPTLRSPLASPGALTLSGPQEAQAEADVGPHTLMSTSTIGCVYGAGGAKELRFVDRRFPAASASHARAQQGSSSSEAAMSTRSLVAAVQTFRGERALGLRP